jgi:hypothetical protein
VETKISPDKLLDSLLSSQRIGSLVEKVRRAIGTDVVIELSDQIEEAGYYDPDSFPPTIVINKKTGLNESNIAHELIHIIQISQGFPTTPKGMFQDKRRKVVIELNSDILHIPLVEEMSRRGIPVKPYIQPTLQAIESVLSTRTDQQASRIPVRRVHYEAAVLIRIRYEFPRPERRRLMRLFESKSPAALNVWSRLENIIANEDVCYPEGNIKALYKALMLFNAFDLTLQAFDFERDLYLPLTDYLQHKYPFLSVRCTN